MRIRSRLRPLRAPK